mmetsp:Transcript_18508/g.53111  ORF Transcript_18508/g.53111 Transcript_18508/m.53111 type:complete len:3364 (-) Transcript_18508:71-10162(-)
MSSPVQPPPTQPTPPITPTASASSDGTVPAYLNLVPGGVGYPLSSIQSPASDGAANTAALAAVQNHYHCLSQAGDPTKATSKAAQLIERAVQCDAALREMALTSSGGNTTDGGDGAVTEDGGSGGGKEKAEPPILLPSLSVLTDAAFGPLTGVNPQSVKKWAEALVMAYLDDVNNDDDVVRAVLEQCRSSNSTSNNGGGRPGDDGVDLPTLLRNLHSHYVTKLTSGGDDGTGRMSSLAVPTRPCGYVFRRGDIAWNCRTCQSDSTCVLCDTCFRESDHTGHDVFFHRTSPGGCCDCGDIEAWRVEGCCDRHRPRVDVEEALRKKMRLSEPSEMEANPSAAAAGGAVAMEEDTSSTEGPTNDDDPDFEAVRSADRSREETTDAIRSLLPPRLAAALGVVIGNAVQSIVRSVDGSAIGSDPVQWEKRWGDQARRVRDGCPTDEDYILKGRALADPMNGGKMTEVQWPPAPGGNSGPLPPRFRLHLRLHNDDVHTFDEVIDALHAPPSSATAHRRGIPSDETDTSHGLVAHRNDADDMTHHVDSDGQVTVRTYTTIAGALAGYRRLKSRGLHCSVVSTSQVESELRSRALLQWLAELCSAHPAAGGMVVHALVDVDDGGTSSDIGGVKMWREGRSIPCWVLNDDASSAQWSEVLPPHLASSFLSREEAERLHAIGFGSVAATGSAVISPDEFSSKTGASPSFYAMVPQHRLPSERYRKSPHALWGTMVLPTDCPDSSETNVDSCVPHPLLSKNGEASEDSPLLERIMVIDTDLRKPQEADRLTTHMFPHKISGLSIISGVGLVDSSGSDSGEEKVVPPTTAEWSHLLSTASYSSPPSAILLVLMLDPYPPKLLRQPLHSLFLSLLIDARFKSRFAAALGVAYRSLTTLFCAGVGTESDTPLGFTVQIFTAGSLVRALGSSAAISDLLCRDGNEVNSTGVGEHILTIPISHNIVRCIHSNLLGSTKEVKEATKAAGPGETVGANDSGEIVNPALVYQAGEHCMATLLPAAPDDEFLDSRSTRHKRLPHLLRDLEYIFETPGTSVRLLLAVATGSALPSAPLQPMPHIANVDPSSRLTFATVWARLLRIGQGMDPQKRRISGGHVEFEQNRWLEAFGLSLNLAGAYDALAESPAVSGLGGAPSDLQILRASVGNIFASLLKEMKSWLYREGLLETGVPVPPTAGALGDLGQLEALQRSTLHLSASQVGPSEKVVGAPTVSAIALSCATSVKMTEAQLSLMEQALQQEAQLAVSSGTINIVPGAVMGDWLRCPHSPLGGDSLSFHLPLHRALARSLRSFCSVTVPTAERESDSTSWWRVPVLDDTPHDDVSASQHPLAALIRPTIRSSNCRVVWAAGPDCTSQEAQERRSRSRMVASSIAAAKIIHSMCDHPLRCVVTSQQIERHLWARNGSAAAGQALNYGSSPLCRSFRDLDLVMVQFSAAGLSVGLGARRVFALLLSRFSLEGYLCDPERRGSGLSPTGSVASGGGSPNSYGPSSGWVHPPRMQDPDHAVALAECFFSTLCILVTELPSPPPTSAIDSSALRCNMKRELLHALVAEPRSHSEAMAAVAGAVTRRDETDSGAGSGDADSATSFRALFADVLKEIGKQKSQGSRSSGTPMFELRAEASDEYDPTFFHLRRHEHQHAMDTVARLRRQKVSPPGSPRAGGNARCLPLVVQPPPSHPRFVSGRLLLHLPALDASIRRALLFALTSGRWLPPDKPTQFLSDDEDNDVDDDEMADSSKSRGLGSGSGLADSKSPSPAVTPRSSPRRSREARRRTFQRNTSSSFVKPRRGNSSLSEIGDDFSPETVAGSSVSFLEVLQILTLQVHTLEESASLHRTHALDEESRSLSAGLSINSYLSRLVFNPPSLVDVWALRCAPAGPLPSKGSGLKRGSVLGLLIALYEHRADHGGGSEQGGDSGHTDEGHGGARALSADGLKWLLRFVNSLVDGAHSIRAACEAASSGRRYHSARDVSQSSPSEVSEGTSIVSSIDPEVCNLVSGMLANLADLWPVEVDNTSSGTGDADRMSAKSREARKAAQRRAMERMMKAQSSFAASLSVENGGAELDAEADDDEEADLCIICRCDDADGENNGPLGFLGHVQRSRALQLRSVAEASCLSSCEETADGLYQAYRVVGDRGCQLRATESMASRPLSCLPVGSIVTVLESKVSSKYDILSRRVKVRYTNPKTEETIEGWGSIQSSQGYVILSPLSTLCYNSSRWGSTRPLIRQCGHAAHLLCVEAHCLSLHQRAAGDQPYDGRFAANIDDGEFLCPLCKQLSNILIPDVGRKAGALSSSRRSSSLVSSPEASPTKVTSPLASASMSSSSISSFRDILCGPCQIDYEVTEEQEDKMVTAIKQFGTRLYLGVQIPWDRMSSSRKREQRAWHPALRRWDFEEEADDDNSPSLGAIGGEDDPAVGGLLRLLRQQHIAWASIGHSVAASEASSRGLMGIEDPWSDYGESTKDTIPAILDLRRTISATSALLEVMSYELGRQLGNESSKLSGMNVTLVGSLLADVLEGRFWSVGLPSPSDDANQRAIFKQWQALTSQIAATPCHVARDGMLPQRHEARAAASALWATKGMGVRSVAEYEQEDNVGSSPAFSYSPATTASTDVAGDQVAMASNGEATGTGIEIPSPSMRDAQARVHVPTPLAVRLVCSEQGIDQPLENAWGTMDPFMASMTSHPSTQAQEDGVEVHLSGGTQDVKPPALFRPAVASAYLYVPLLAWDMNTLAGAIFSSILVNNEDSMPVGNDNLLLCSRTLLLGRLVQVLVTPGGFDKAVELDPNDWEAQEARDEFQEQWEKGDMINEAKALADLLKHCRDAVGAMSSNWIDSVVQIDSAEDAAQFLHSVGLAILPFARSLVLLLRGCSSLLRQQEKKDTQVENPFKLDKDSATTASCAFEALLESPETMTYGDGFRILRGMGGPLPSQILKGSSPSHVSGTPPSSWFALINRWLSSINGFESYHGSKGSGLVFDEQSGTWTLPSASRSDANSKAQEAGGGRKKFIVKEQGLQTASSSEATSTMGVEIEVAPSAEEEEEDSEGHQGIAYNESIDMDDASAGFDDGIANAEEEDIELEDDANMEMFDVDDEDDSDDEAEMEDVEMIGDSSGSQASLYGLEDSGVDVSDDEDSPESNPALSAASKVDKEFANVSRSAIIPFQSSLLGFGGIGPGPRGNSFEYSHASLMMADLSHLGMVHRIGSAASGLIRLPHSFVELYSLVNKVKGRTDIAIGAMDDADDGGSTETAICLITGSVMAAGSSRRPYSRGARPPGACTLHAQQVGSGVGIFFLVQKCTVLLIHNNKSAYSASLYVDEHGEEDPGLRRGRPLFLKDERYESLEKLWREHSIPREVAQTRSTSDRVIRDNWY